MARVAVAGLHAGEVFAADMAGVIGDDPGLTARLPRLVNRAFESSPPKIDTVTRAVTVVGTQQLSDLALTTSVTPCVWAVAASARAASGSRRLGIPRPVPEHHPVAGA